MTRFDSSKWTGPLEEGLARPRHGPVPAINYARIAEAQRAAAPPIELRGVIRLAALLFFLAPLALGVSWFALRTAIRDAAVQDNAQVLILWGLFAMLLASFQITSRSRFLRGFRLAGLSTLLAVTLGLAVAYLYVGLTAHAHATVSEPERTFEFYESRGPAKHRYVVTKHPRADGTTIEGGSVGVPVPEARVCTLVQRVQGDYGFLWVRVLDRSPSPKGGQLAWPITRDECFSARPLAELGRS